MSMIYQFIIWLTAELTVSKFLNTDIFYENFADEALRSQFDKIHFFLEIQATT